MNQMIRRDNRVVLLLPRNASTSIQQLAESFGLTPDASKRFLTYEEIKGDLPSNAMFYVVSRNPYDRIFSAYVANKLRSLPFHTRKTILEDGIPASMKQSFARFVMEGLAQAKSNRREYFPMAKFVQGIPPESLRKIALENATVLRAGLRTFLGMKELSSIPHVQTTLGQTSYVGLYTPEMCDVVNALYAEDFALFGYLMVKF